MKVDNETGSVALLQATGDDLRSTPAMEDADRELRASIAAHGLLEPPRGFHTTRPETVTPESA